MKKTTAKAKKETISDDLGSSWSAWCPECREKSMVIVRPGKVQCDSEKCYEAKKQKDSGKLPPPIDSYWSKSTKSPHRKLEVEPEAKARKLPRDRRFFVCDYYYTDGKRRCSPPCKRCVNLKEFGIATSSAMCPSAWSSIGKLRDRHGYCFSCGLSENGMSKSEEKQLAKDIKSSKKEETKEILFVSKKDAKIIRDYLIAEYRLKDGVLRAILNRVFNSSPL